MTLSAWTMKLANGGDPEYAVIRASAVRVDLGEFLNAMYSPRNVLDWYTRKEMLKTYFTAMGFLSYESAEFPRTMIVYSGLSRKKHPSFFAVNAGVARYFDATLRVNSVHYTIEIVEAGNHAIKGNREGFEVWTKEEG